MISTTTSSSESSSRVPHCCRAQARTTTMRIPAKVGVVVTCCFLLCSLESNALQSNFLGQAVTERDPIYYQRSCYSTTKSTNLFMRKQKASDRRTRRRQRGDDLQELQPAAATTTATSTFTVSPMAGATWKHKQQQVAAANAVSQVAKQKSSRGRSRKRTALYQSLAHYQNHFLQQLTAEYQAEVSDMHNAYIVFLFFL